MLVGLIAIKPDSRVANSRGIVVRPEISRVGLKGTRVTIVNMKVGHVTTRVSGVGLWEGS